MYPMVFKYVKNLNVYYTGPLKSRILSTYKSNYESLFMVTNEIQTLQSLIGAANYKCMESYDSNEIRVECHNYRKDTYGEEHEIYKAELIFENIELSSVTQVLESLTNKNVHKYSYNFRLFRMDKDLN